MVDDLWTGELVQKNNEDDEIECKNVIVAVVQLLIHYQSDIPFDETRPSTFWSHLDVSRLSVPRSA